MGPLSNGQSTYAVKALDVAVSSWVGDGLQIYSSGVVAIAPTLRSSGFGGLGLESRTHYRYPSQGGKHHQAGANRLVDCKKADRLSAVRDGFSGQIE